ncbi:MAG: MarR family winged helix-turn-helix transcriptional regulator [Alphaproteobacteria bacterium]|nr:MarR family winged helix-turn-helix transcriptional regulator [Alphaproteobacteria bacterium]
MSDQMNSVMKSERPGAIHDHSGSSVGREFPPVELRRRGARFQVLSNLFHRHFTATVGSSQGVDMVEARIIESSYYCPGVIAKEIIDFWAFDKMAVSRAISRLEKKGLLERHANRRDRRRNEIFLTSSGQEMHRVLDAYKDHVTEHLEDWMGPERTVSFSESVERLIGLLSALIEEKRDRQDDSR